MSRQNLSVGSGLAALCVMTLSGLALWCGTAAGQGKVIPPENDVPEVDIMQAKLRSAQDVLTGLVMRDGGMIAKSGHELVALCKTDAWSHVENDPVYTHFSVEFHRQAERLARMGETKNLDGAAYAYQGLTATCIACHEHVRDVSPIQPAGKR